MVRAAPARDPGHMETNDQDPTTPQPEPPATPEPETTRSEAPGAEPPRRVYRSRDQRMIA